MRRHGGPGARTYFGSIAERLIQPLELLGLLAAQAGLGESLTQRESVENGSWRIFKRAAAQYQGDLTVYDCLAIRPS